jgi:hypothetical protein
MRRGSEGSGTVVRSIYLNYVALLLTPIFLSLQKTEKTQVAENRKRKSKRQKERTKCRTEGGASDTKSKGNDGESTDSYRERN